MRKKHTRILLLEDNLADAGFVREALGELEEIQNGNAWLSPFELCDAETLEEALQLLKDISFDVILADLWTPDSGGLATFQRLKAAAPQTPLIVLMNTEDPGLTVRLMQEGAQDVLVKHEVDCTPLGRALRCAIERNRISSGLRRLSVRDELTGLLNFTGFLQLGEPYCRLLRRKTGQGLRSAPRTWRASGVGRPADAVRPAEIARLPASFLTPRRSPARSRALRRSRSEPRTDRSTRSRARTSRARQWPSRPSHQRLPPLRRA